MPIRNIDGLSNQEVVTELQNGGKFVIFYYSISIIVMTFRRGSGIYFVRAGENPIKFGWKFLLISILLGWWGFPWGPIYTVQSLITAFKGKDITKEVMAQFARGTSALDVTYDRKF